MSKTNIVFNNTNYSIDDTSLSTATSALRTHLSTVMNGSGATINFAGVPYGIDSAKLSTATNAFISHLGTIAGSGSKVVVGGVEYPVSSAKLENATAEMHVVLSGLNSSSGDDDGSNGGYARFNDGVTLTWAELQDPANGVKYGYDASKITDTTLYSAFKDNEYILELVIPEGVTNVDDNAFCAKYIESVTFPSTATYIGYRIVFPTTLKQMKYNGTMEQLRQLDANYYNELLSTFLNYVDCIECIDGTIVGDISFSIENENFKAQENMTWRNWINSSYSNINPFFWNWSCSDTGEVTYVSFDHGKKLTLNEVPVHADDTIIKNAVYGGFKLW